MHLYNYTRDYLLIAMKILVSAICISLYGQNVLAQSSGGQDTIFTLTNSNLNDFYPSKESPNLPEFYKNMKGFPETLSQSVTHFMTASLKADGIAADLDVVPIQGGVKVMITNASPSAAQYAKIFPDFMSDWAAGQGLSGAQACQQATGCWNPNPNADPNNNAPWAFFLPLGLAMANQKVVMLLNYPPSDALCAVNYNNNFTMDRWNRILKAGGIEKTSLYTTILDSHPIAAPGSNESNAIYNTTDYFKTYIDAMLDLILPVQPDSGQNRTIPLQIAGYNARVIWEGIIGHEITVGNAYLYEREGKPAIPWVATNHPDVTTYQGCPLNDQTETSDGYSSTSLIQDELLDLNAICVLKTLSENPTMDTEAARTDCAKIWCVDSDSPSCQRHTICVQARQDYNYVSDGHCACQAAATAFCQANNDDICPSQSRAGNSCAQYNNLCANQPTAYATCSSLNPQYQ